MISYSDALSARNFEHLWHRNADGTFLRARRSGRTQIWKRRPGQFRIPVKYGFRDSFHIDHVNCVDWRVAP